MIFFHYEYALVNRFVCSSKLADMEFFYSDLLRTKLSEVGVIFLHSNIFLVNLKGMESAICSSFRSKDIDFALMDEVGKMELFSKEGRHTPLKTKRVYICRYVYYKIMYIY